MSSCISITDGDIKHPWPLDIGANVIDTSLHIASISPLVHVGGKLENQSVGRSNIEYRGVNILNGKPLTNGMIGGSFRVNTQPEAQFLRVTPVGLSHHSVKSGNKLISVSFIKNSSFPISLSILLFSASGITS